MNKIDIGLFAPVHIPQDEGKGKKRRKVAEEDAQGNPIPVDYFRGEDGEWSNDIDYQ